MFGQSAFFDHCCEAWVFARFPSTSDCPSDSLQLPSTPSSIPCCLFARSLPATEFRCSEFGGHNLLATVPSTARFPLPWTNGISRTCPYQGFTSSSWSMEAKWTRAKRSSSKLRGTTILQIHARLRPATHPICRSETHHARKPLPSTRIGRRYCISGPFASASFGYF